MNKTEKCLAEAESDTVIEACDGTQISALTYITDQGVMSLWGMVGVLINDRCDFNTFFPSWSIVFAPIGIAVIGWGWWNIRDNRWQSFITFLIGCILWMYGFAAVLMRISMF